MDILKLRKRKKWLITIWDFFGDRLIEVSPPPIWEPTDAIYTSLLKSCANRNQIGILSQMLSKREKVRYERKGFSKISDSLFVDYRFTRGLDDLDLPTADDQNCFLFIKGGSDYSWIGQFIDYNYPDLPVVLFGMDRIVEDWIPEITYWYKNFKEWYNLRMSGEQIVNIRNKISYIAWNSDSDLFFLVENSGEVKVLLSIHELALEKHVEVEIRHYEDRTFE